MPGGIFKPWLDPDDPGFGIRYDESDLRMWHPDFADDYAQFRKLTTQETPFGSLAVASSVQAGEAASWTQETAGEVPVNIGEPTPDAFTERHVDDRPQGGIQVQPTGFESFEGHPI